VQSSRARTRQLWGRGKGRFRTRGRHSTATVRGTYWLTKDSCNSTVTVVREGVVTVHDFAKNKDVKVKAGKRYIARAAKKKKR
jgi:ferric-dicitrate binding protein FerR (iron transport regulator)